MVIYKITNQINGKPYIGQTRQPIEKRFLQHASADTPLGNDMKEFGRENFTIEIVAECESIEQANQYEKLCIKVLACKVPNGYNQTDGGEGGYSTSKTSSDSEKSTLDLFAEENNLNADDKDFIKSFLMLEADSRATLKKICGAFEFRDKWKLVDEKTLALVRAMEDKFQSGQVTA